MLRFIFLFVLPLAFGQSDDAEKENGIWPRWEQRTIRCTNSTQGLDCHLEAPGSRTLSDTNRFKCHREPMPKTTWNGLPESETRIACPIGCAPEADLSVIQKTPYNNPKCVKYFTYGKYRDARLKEWFLWKPAEELKHRQKA
ncbi:unnamed protein product, partial [Mesorhabditis spiculigera]